MTSVATSLTEGLEQQMAALDTQGQPSWLSAVRQEGLTQFRAQGLPTKRSERWKYTSLQPLEARDPRLGSTVEEADPSVFTQPLVQAGVRVMLQDGRCIGIHGARAEGLSVMPMEEALAEGDERLQEMLAGLEISDHSAGLAALNTAVLRDGIFIRVGAGVEAGRVLLQWASSGQAASLMATPRVCILLEAGSRLELVEQFESGADGESQMSLVVQANVAEKAHLRHTRLQQENDQAILVTRTEVRQSAGSEYHYSGLDFGGALVRHDVRARLGSTGAACSLNGASFTRGRCHVDNHLDAEHLAVDCSSSQLFRAVLGDRSRVVFNGRVYVAPGADGTDARQSSAGLLLSPLAEIDSKPELEIYADEVVASHGATVGQLDPDQLFYLQSRGLDRDAARNLLTVAFCRTVIDLLPDESLRESLEARLHASLDAAGIRRG